MNKRQRVSIATAKYKAAKELGVTFEAYLGVHRRARAYARAVGRSIPRPLPRKHGLGLAGDA